MFRYMDLGHIMAEYVNNVGKINTIFIEAFRCITFDHKIPFLSS